MTFPSFRDNEIDLYKTFKGLKRYFDKEPTFRRDERYVVVWYEELSKSTKDNSEVLAKVVFFNLDLKNAVYQPTLLVPITTILKLPIGSIWINGIYTSEFQLEEFKFTLDDKTMYKPSEVEINEINERIESAYPVYKILEDKNSVIKADNINENNDSILIHPILFFIIHFGYSMEIKRLLLTLEWGIENGNYMPNEENFINRCLLTYHNSVHDNIKNLVYLPRKFVPRDSVLLHFLKVNEYAKDVVRDFNQYIRRQIRDSRYKFYLEVEPWHQDPIEVTCNGFRLDNETIICTSITAMSEPKFIDGEEINAMVSPHFKNPVKGVDHEVNGIYQPIRKKRSGENVELNPDHPANNLETVTVKKLTTILGKRWIVNLNQEELKGANNNNLTPIYNPEPLTYATGEVSNSRGETGYAGFAFEDNDVVTTKGSRLDTLWAHAKALQRYHTNKNITVEWFTYRLGFHDDDTLKCMSLEAISKSSSSYPKEVLVIRLIIDGKPYYIIDSYERENDSTDKASGMSGIIVKVEDEEEFLHADESVKSLLSIITTISNSGSLSKVYIKSFDGQLATFVHKTAINNDNNWVLNGLGKIEDK